MANFTTDGIKTLSASWSGGAGRLVVNGDFAGKAKAVFMINDGSGWVSAGPDGIINSPQAIRFEAGLGDGVGIFIRSVDTFSIDATVAPL